MHTAPSRRDRKGLFMNTAMSYPNAGTPNTASLSPSAPSRTKPLWAVIGVLGMCVLALGASLVSIHKRSVDPSSLSDSRFQNQSTRKLLKK